jgi:hypothetical protein
MAKKIVTAPARGIADYAASAEGETLEQCRVNAADASLRQYGASDRYARKMIDTFGLNFWRKESTSFKLYQDERAAYMAILKNAGHTNPSQEWSRIIKKADAICNPPEPGGANDTSSLLVRQIDWLKAMYKSGRREEKKAGFTDKEQEIHLSVMKILRETCKINPEDIK